MSGNGSSGLSGLSGDELRAEVRAVLRELLPAMVGQASGDAGPQPEDVALRSDADLDAFARRIAALCEDPAQRAAIRDGRRRFRLAGDAPRAAGAGRAAAAAVAAGRSGAATGGVVRIDSGAVTERRVTQAAADGARLVLGRRAVLTPLARDRARTLGVVIEKER
jgi:hypothetical protein